MIQGLGAASSVSLNARDIILRTTTQTSVASIEGPNGISTGTRTNVDRIATLSADSVQLAALNNISLQGASVTAKEDLLMTAGGVITSEAVQTGYTLNIPLGGGGAQGRSSYYNVASTTQQLTHARCRQNRRRSPPIGDANFKGTNVTAGTNLAVQAQNIIIEAAKDSLAIDQQGVNRKGYERVAQADEALAGAIFSAGNNLALIANGSKALDQGNITVTGATVVAGTGQASLIANNNIAIQNATTEHSQLAESYDSSKSFLSKKSTQRSDSSQTTEVNGSNIIGNTVLVQAGNDATIQASELNAVNDAQINAGRDVNITTAQESTSASSLLRAKEERPVGQPGPDQHRQVRARPDPGPAIHHAGRQHGERRQRQSNGRTRRHHHGQRRLGRQGHQRQRRPRHQPERRHRYGEHPNPGPQQLHRHRARSHGLERPLHAVRPEQRFPGREFSQHQPEHQPALRQQRQPDAHGRHRCAIPWHGPGQRHQPGCGLARQRKSQHRRQCG